MIDDGIIEKPRSSFVGAGNAAKFKTKDRGVKFDLNAHSEEDSDEQIGTERKLVDEKKVGSEFTSQ